MDGAAAGGPTSHSPVLSNLDENPIAGTPPGRSGAEDSVSWCPAAILTQSVWW
jgi:hypothetical protein